MGAATVSMRKWRMRSWATEVVKGWTGEAILLCMSAGFPLQEGTWHQDHDVYT